MTTRRVLLDENMPLSLRLLLPRVEAETVEFRGWKGLRNGDLIRRARDHGFDVLVTADRRLAMTPRNWSPMACVFLTSNKRRRVRAIADQIEAACSTVLPGQVFIVQV